MTHRMSVDSDMFVDMGAHGVVCQEHMKSPMSSLDKAIAESIESNESHRWVYGLTGVSCVTSIFEVFV